MTPLGAWLLVALVLPLIWLLLTGRYFGALCYGVFLLVSQSRFMVIELPGAMPNLTIHRLTLILLWLGWLRRPDLRARLRAMPFRRLFVLWMVVGACSLLGSQNLSAGVRPYLSFVIEVYVLYLLLSTSIVTAEESRSILRSVFLGLALVGAIAVVERYQGTNPLMALNPAALRGKPARDVISMMDHRILLGTGMAMGWPVGIGLLRDAKGAAARLVLLLGTGLLIAACYYAMSRGPWIASALGGAVLLALMPRKARGWPLAIVTALLVTVALRPGVVETLVDRTQNTFEENTLKHNTFMYRLELWKIAYAGISQSSWRVLFGNGPGAAGGTDFLWTPSYGGAQLTVRSWDSHFAAQLYNTGFVGLSAIVMLLGRVLWRIFRSYTQSDPDRRVWFACIAGSATAFVFMMTNVFIFAPQLNYAFWSLVGAGIGLESTTTAAEPATLEPSGEWPIDEGTERACV